MLTIHQLEVLRTVAEEGSVRGAAERLVVSQPAVSATLAALERELDVELVAKRGRGIELTPAGETMAGYACSLLALLGEAVDATRAEAGNGADDDGAGVVRLGATTGSASHVLVPLLARVRELRAEFDFVLEVANRARIWRQLAEREIDVALSTRPPATGAYLSLATRPNEFVLVASPGAFWSGRLSEATWLLREEGSSTRAAMDQVMAQLDLGAPSLVISSNDAIQQSAESGLGIALLPAEVVQDALRRRSLVVVPTPATPLVRPWHLVARTGELLAAPARRLVRDLVAVGSGFELTVDGERALAAPV